MGINLIPLKAEEGLSTSDFRLATCNFQPTSNFVLELFVLMFPSQGFVKLWSLIGPGVRFWNINGPVKLLLFTCKIEVSIVLHQTCNNQFHYHFSETKWSCLLARTRALILYTSIWIFDFGPEKLPGLSTNGPQVFFNLPTDSASINDTSIWKSLNEAKVRIFGLCYVGKIKSKNITLLPILCSAWRCFFFSSVSVFLTL